VEGSLLDSVCVRVCGPAPLLGCRPIRVRVESIYIVSHLLSIQQFTFLHGIRLGLGFFPHLPLQQPAAPSSRNSRRPPPTSTAVAPGGSSLPPGAAPFPAAGHPSSRSSPSLGGGRRSDPPPRSTLPRRQQPRQTSSPARG
jgi:hypothetical protein